MLSTNMAENNESRIEFPDKNPAEWKVFYPFIDPSKIGMATPSATINDENVRQLSHGFMNSQWNHIWHSVINSFLKR